MDCNAYLLLFQTDQMIGDLTVVFKEMLPKNEWMDAETKAAANEKVDQITPNIAYPEYILDPNDDKMEKDLEDVVINSKEFFANAQDLIKLNIKKSLGKLRKPVDFSE